MAKENDLVTLFTEIGLTEQKAKETLKNETLSEVLKDVVLEVLLLPYMESVFQSSTLPR